MSKTVRVRIAVAVDASGNWNTCGCQGYRDKDAMLDVVEPLSGDVARYWIEAEVLIPEVAIVAGEVSNG